MQLRRAELLMSVGKQEDGGWGRLQQQLLNIWSVGKSVTPQHRDDGLSEWRIDWTARARQTVNNSDDDVIGTRAI